MSAAYPARVLSQAVETIARDRHHQILARAHPLRIVALPRRLDLPPPNQIDELGMAFHELGRPRPQLQGYHVRTLHLIPIFHAGRGQAPIPGELKERAMKPFVGLDPRGKIVILQAALHGLYHLGQRFELFRRRMVSREASHGQGFQGGQDVVEIPDVLEEEWADADPELACPHGLVHPQC